MSSWLMVRCLLQRFRARSVQIVLERLMKFRMAHTGTDNLTDEIEAGVEEPV